MKTCVILRAHDDMPLVAETLAGLSRQEADVELIAFDNASEDGTLREIRKHTDRIVNVPRGEYVPGRVLNEAMRRSEGEVVVFLNSDCTPTDSRWLDRLLDGIREESVAAVFGRQIPRPDCHVLHAKDVEDTYGDGTRQGLWRHCFSMASSAIRRSVWEEMPFDEEIRYSEDIDWTWRARQSGHEIRYVASSVVYHSHNYSLGQLYRRHHGEGRAEATIFDWEPWERSLLRYSVLPWGRQVLSDWRHCLGRGALLSALSSPGMRLAQAIGRRRGFRRGLREGGRRAGVREPELLEVG